MADIIAVALRAMWEHQQAAKRATLTTLDPEGEWEPGVGIHHEEATVAFDVVEPEVTSWPTMATHYPVEDGRDISDHVHLQPITVELTGIITGEEAAQKIFILRKWRDRKDRLRYEHRNIFTNYVITSLETTHSYQVHGGFMFDITLQQVRIIQPAVTNTPGKGTVTPDPAKQHGPSKAPSKVVSEQRGIASWYGPGFHGKTTASGETFDQNAMTAAHKTLPFNTRVQVERLSTGRTVIVRINDRGPFVSGRIIDLSMAAAEALSIKAAGVARVIVRRLG